MPTNKPDYEKLYRQKVLKRIPLDVHLDLYDQIKTAATESGESVNGWIKKAISDRLTAQSSQGNASNTSDGK